MERRIFVIWNLSFSVRRTIDDSPLLLGNLSLPPKPKYFDKDIISKKYFKASKSWHESVTEDAVSAKLIYVLRLSAMERNPDATRRIQKSIVDFLVSL